jgi:chromosome segregation ATPase
MKRKPNVEVEKLEEESEPSNDEPAYHDGSIVSITLENFVTYSYATIKPGPNLNVVIGPNGSGKSSIVSAIALGLGESPKILARGKTIDHFIKHGEDNCLIEIELFHRDGNVTFRREVGRKTNSRMKKNSWKINGKAVTKEDVITMVRSLNIQLDNLCQFLPQDRVAAFAQLTRPELLKATEKSIGGEELLATHKELVEIKKKQLNFATDLLHQKNNLNDLKLQNEALEGEVSKFKEREAIVIKTANLKKKIKALEHEELKSQVLEAKTTVDAAKRNLDLAEKDLLPLEKEFKDLQNKMKRKEDEFERGVTEARKKDVQKETVLKNFKEYASEIEKNKQLIASLGKRLQENQDKQAEQERVINVLKEELGRCKNKTEIQAEMNKIDADAKQLKAQNHEFQSQKNEIKEKCDEILRSKEEKSRYLRNLNDETNQKTERLRKAHPQVHQAMEWVKKNQNLFKHEIHNPPILQVNIKDRKYIPLLEGACGRHLTVIIVHPDDYNVLHENLFDRMRLTRIMVVSQALEDWRGDFSYPNAIDLGGNNNELKKLGASTTLDQCFNCTSEMIKKYLVTTCKLNESVIVENVEQNLASVEKILSVKGVKKLYSLTRSYDTTTSAYGSRDRAVRNMPLKLTDLLLQGGVDKSQEEEAKRAIRRLDDEMAEMSKEMKEYNDKSVEITRALEELNRKKSKTVAEFKKESAILDKIKETEKKLKILRDEKIDQDETKYKNKQVKLQQERLKSCKDMVKLVEEITKLILENNMIAVHIMQFKNDLTLLERSRSLKVARKNDRKNEYDEQVKKYEILKQRSAEKKRQLDPPSRELAAIFAELPSTIEELEINIQHCETRIEQLFIQNEHILLEFDQRKARIAELELAVANNQTSNERDIKRIEEIEQTWLPKLELSIKRINDKFKEHMGAINCGGEIRLEKKDDYDLWEIQIWVTFRKDKPLSLLDSRIQSGGEKSVSTMLYLISMHDMTSCPFRLVDEINQGMDTSNERNIFDRVVESSCKKNLPQYFLITPKLLIDLKYDPLITVLCVFNGPWVKWNYPERETNGVSTQSRAIKANTKRGKKKQQSNSSESEEDSS